MKDIIKAIRIVEDKYSPKIKTIQNRRYSGKSEEEQRLPAHLHAHRNKTVGLMIDADRLAQIRETRRPGSPYASLKQCHWEVDAAESLLRSAGIAAFATTHSSIEEIASRILVHLGMQREMY